MPVDEARRAPLARRAVVDSGVCPLSPLSGHRSQVDPTTCVDPGWSSRRAGRPPARTPATETAPAVRRRRSTSSAAKAAQLRRPRLSAALGATPPVSVDPVLARPGERLIRRAPASRARGRCRTRCSAPATQDRADDRTSGVRGARRHDLLAQLAPPRSRLAITSTRWRAASASGAASAASRRAVDGPGPCCAAPTRARR